MRTFQKILLMATFFVLAWALAAAFRPRAWAIPRTGPPDSEAPTAVVSRPRLADPYRVYRRMAARAKTSPAESSDSFLTEESYSGGHERHPKRPPTSEWIGNLPPVPAGGVEERSSVPHRLSWASLAATTVDGNARPHFSEALSVVDGSEVRLAGYMTPLEEYGLVDVFLLVPYPVGCFYCQSPGPTAVVLVDTGGRRARIQSEPIEVRGTLRLNHDRQDDFLFACLNATIAPLRAE